VKRTKESTYSGIAHYGMLLVAVSLCASFDTMSMSFLWDGICGGTAGIMT
jgi:hypothetical protein